MPSHRPPGVHLEELPGNMPPIEPVGTSTAAFLGATVRGPVGAPVRIGDWHDYTERFGGVRPAGGGPPAHAMDHAIRAFFKNGGSEALVVRVVDEGTSGTEPDPPRTEDYRRALDELRDQQKVSVVALPGRFWTADPARSDVTDTLEAALLHCENLGDRMLLVDPPPDEELRSRTDVEALGLPTSSYAALYYPWVEVPPPHAGDEPPGSAAVRVPPSGFVAGVYARTDRRRGVWTAPAGVDSALAGTTGLAFSADHGVQSVLTPMGVNCLRLVQGRGPLVWGARTLATGTHPEWRYVPVRRLAIYLEESIRRGTTWVASRVNNETLWTGVTEQVEAFLAAHFRAGAFQGDRPEDAYYVRCGLGETMTAADIEAGRVIMEVGFAPLRPAEFVVLRIAPKSDQPSGQG